MKKKWKLNAGACSDYWNKICIARDLSDTVQGNSETFSVQNYHGSYQIIPPQTLINLLIQQRWEHRIDPFLAQDIQSIMEAVSAFFSCMYDCREIAKKWKCILHKLWTEHAMSFVIKGNIAKWSGIDQD